ncbi:proline--tRNA ligase, partial [Candidatus Woesearchaeota archaeon]|nr:proline--tRNA ligase [Candidatus Woesearchaeota archaeon]
YFPLLIPESYFKREAEHAKGFAPELAWVDQEKNEERLAIRPTSEAIITDFFSKWIRSYRDLPLRLNQWCNVLRWEVKQTKLLLRTREFLWQEGHCAYATEQEAEKEALLFLNEYKKLAEELLAIPVLIGEKTEKEKFAGAKKSFTCEAFMPDGKTLQMATSHNLGDNFGKTFNVCYIGEDKQKHYAFQNSWGCSTRLIGSIVMAHGDDKGLVLPPNLAPTQVVIVPILFDDSKAKVLKKADEIKKQLSDFTVDIDSREHYSAGWKFNEHEMNGVPIRLEIGPKDVSNDQVVLVRRDTLKKEIIKTKDLKKKISLVLEDIQKNLFSKAKKHLDSSIVKVKSWKEFISAIKDRKLVLAPFCGSPDCEDNIKSKTEGANSRCTPFNQKPIKAKCVQCNKEAKNETYFSKSY